MGEQRLSDGDIIFRQGDKGNEMYEILEGGVEVVRTKDGKEVRLGVLKAGDFFGEMSLILDAPRSATARAHGTTRLRVIDRTEFEGLSAGDDVVKGLLAGMAERIRDVDDRLERADVQHQYRTESIGEFISARRQFF